MLPMFLPNGEARVEASLSYGGNSVHAPSTHYVAGLNTLKRRLDLRDARLT